MNTNKGTLDYSSQNVVLNDIRVLGDSHYRVIEINTFDERYDLRQIIKNILVLAPRYQHYIEVKSSNTKVVEMLRQEKFEEGEIFLHINYNKKVKKYDEGNLVWETNDNDETWLGFVVGPHIVACW